MSPTRTRRDFLRASAGLAVLTPLASRGFADETRNPNDRPRLGAIGVGGRGSGIARNAKTFGDFVAVCDVDRSHADAARVDPKLGAGKADVLTDYRKLLDRDDIDAVTIGTPDHWHTRIAIDAMRAGKDVYCEKPLTLTIDEGKKLRAVVQETGRVFQVGTQQRSEFRNMFLTAVALVREGRLGKINKVTCAIGASGPGGPFEKTEPPAGLDWDMWLGQAPKVDYIKQRCHNTFRWWYEYSGGKLTDWGAHHVDIAHWALGLTDDGPLSIDPAEAELAQPLKNGMPVYDDRYNTVGRFLVRCAMPNDVELIIRHDTENGVTFEGDKGKIFVSRGKLTGAAVTDLKSNPLPDDVLTKLRKGKPLDNHMANFFACVKDRGEPVSDVASHHRSITTCHLANIALRLGRPLKWDAKSEQIVGDSEANAWLTRDQRKGYEVPS
jgi:predicted dehydrogenase